MSNTGVLGIVNNTRMDAYCHSFGQDALAFANWYSAKYDRTVFELISEHYPTQIGVWPNKYVLRGDLGLPFDRLIIHSQRSLEWCAADWARRDCKMYPPSTMQALNLLSKYRGDILYVLSDLRADYLQLVTDLPKLAPNANSIAFCHLGTKPFEQITPIGKYKFWPKYRLNATAGPWNISPIGDSIADADIDIAISGFQFSGLRFAQLSQLAGDDTSIMGIGRTEPYFKSYTDNKLVDRYTLRQKIERCIAMPMLLEHNQVQTGPWLTSRFCELMLWGKLPLMPAMLSKLYKPLLGNEFTKLITCSSPAEAKLKIAEYKAKGQLYYSVFEQKSAFLERVHAY